MEKLNKLSNSLMPALVFCSIIIAVNGIIDVFISYTDFGFKNYLTAFSSANARILNYLFCYFAVSAFTVAKPRYYPFFSLLCLYFSYAVTGAYTSVSTDFMNALAVSAISVLCFIKLDRNIGMIIAFLTSLIAGLLLAPLNEGLLNLSMIIADFTGRKGIITSVLFPPFDTLFSLFNSSMFRDLLYEKSYGGAMLINESIVCGVKELYKYGYRGAETAGVMGGKYLFLFASAGVSFNLFGEVKEGHKTALIFSFLSFALSGNPFVFLLYLLMQSPHMLVLLLPLSSLCYAAAYSLKIKSGFLNDASLIELFLNIDKPLYLLTSGAVLFSAGYFIMKYILLRFGISDIYNVYIPSRLNGIVDSLGGVGNIIRSKNNFIEVRNPALVNELYLDCDINENIIKSDNEMFIELTEYIKKGTL
jgi:hypothetical protein